MTDSAELPAPVSRTPTVPVPHLVLLARDPAPTARWWCRTLGFEHSGTLGRDLGCHAVLRHPESGLVIGVRARTPNSSDGRASYLSLRVASRAALDSWAAHLDKLRVPHSAVCDAGDRRFLTLAGPDGVGLELWWPKPR